MENLQNFLLCYTIYCLCGIRAFTLHCVYLKFPLDNVQMGPLCCYRTIFCLSALRRFDPSLAVFTRLVMYSFQVGHYATSDNLVSQSLHAFSLRLLVTRDFLAPFLRLLL